MKDHIKKGCMPKCEQCIFVDMCPGHCLGNGYENFKNPLIPPQPICNLYKAKYTFLLYKYKQMGLLEYIDDFTTLNDSFRNYLKDLIQILITDNGKLEND